VVGYPFTNKLQKIKINKFKKEGSQRAPAPLWP